MLRDIISGFVKPDKYSKKFLSCVISGIYRDIVYVSRLPIFYVRGGVSDTPLGRFEVLSMHIGLVCLYMESGGVIETHRFAQSLHDHLIRDLDRALRDLGTGDLSVKRKIRRLAEAFHGRMRAYERGLADSGDSLLCEAIGRNMLGNEGGQDTASGGESAQEEETDSSKESKKDLEKDIHHALLFAAYMRAIDKALRAYSAEDRLSRMHDRFLTGADSFTAAGDLGFPSADGYFNE